MFYYFDYERVGKRFEVFDCFTGVTFFHCATKDVAAQLTRLLGGVLH